MYFEAQADGGIFAENNAIYHFFMAKQDVFEAVIRVNQSQAKNELKTLENELHQLQESQKRLLASRKKGDAEAGKMMQKSIDELKQRVGTQKKLVAGIGHSLDDLSKKSYKELQSTVRALEKELRSGHWEKHGDDWKAIAAKIREARGEMDSFKAATQKQESVGKRFFKFLNDSWGGVVIIFQSLTGISQTIRSAVNDFAEMEERMADTRKYTGLTTEQVRELNEEFKKIDTRTSREELNKLAGAAGRLGITSKEGILEFVDAADKISVALGDDLGDGAVDQIGKLAMAFGEDDRMGLRGAMLATGSAVNELAQNSAAKAGYLVEFTARVAGVGKQLGLTQAQIMGYGTVMDEAMLKDEMAATAFSQFIMKMSQESAKFSKFAGMEAGKFQKLVKEDINGAILALADNIRKQDPTNMLKMFSDMGLEGSRAVGVLTNMADKIDDVRRHQDTANKAYEDGSSVIEEFLVMNDTAEARMDKVKKTFTEMTVELGEKLLPVVKYTISSAGLLAKGLNILAGFTIKNWKAIVTLASGMATYYVAIKMATIKEAALTAAMVIRKGVTVAMTTITAALTAATTTLGLVYDLLTGKIKIATFVQQMHNKVVMANPYIAAAAAVMTLVTAIISLTGKTDTLTNSQKALQDATKEAEQDIAGEKAELNALVATAQNKANSDDVRRAAINKLQEKYPDYLKNLSLEKINSREAAKSIDNLTESLLAEAKARILVQKIQDAERRKEELSEEYFSGLSGLLHSIDATMNALPFAIADAAERTKNFLQGLGRGSLGGWDEKTSIEEAGYFTTTSQGVLTYYERAVKTVEDEIKDLNKELKATVVNMQKMKTIGNEKENTGIAGSIDTTQYRTESEIKKDIAEKEKRAAVLRKEQSEQKKMLRERAEEVKAKYQEELAEEIFRYRTGEISYTEFMKDRHGITQKYYDRLKELYGEDAVEYKKMLAQREQEESDYYQWKAAQDERSISVDRLLRDQEIRRTFMQKSVVDNEAMEEALFMSEMEYLRRKQELHKKGSKEWDEVAVQIQARGEEHRFDLEKRWLERLSTYREEMGRIDYEKLQEIELRGVETFYGALLKEGKLTQDEYDAIIEHIKRKYAGLRGEQTASNDTEEKARKGLDTAKKNAGAKEIGGGHDAVTGLLSITQAIKQQKLVNEKLKELYGEDYENNLEYQEAKRQLDNDTWSGVIKSAQAAYQTISTIISAASAYAQACSDLEVARISANYDRQIGAAGKNSKKRERLEKEKDAAIAKAKTKANKKAMKMELAQAVAQTALGAISAYATTWAGAKYPASLWLAPLSAGLALAAGGVQIATIKKQHEAEAMGYYKGGFTGGHRYGKEAGVVHQGEFVANHDAVNNKSLAPVFSLIDLAQKSNRVGALRAEDVTNVIGSPAAAQVIAPIVNVQSYNGELNDTLEKVRLTQDRLATQLEQGIGVDVPIDGENGIYRKIKRYENLMRNK